MGADQARESLGSAAARHDPEEDFRLTDEEVPVGHDAQDRGPRRIRLPGRVPKPVQGATDDAAAPTIILRERRRASGRADRRRSAGLCPPRDRGYPRGRCPWPSRQGGRGAASAQLGFTAPPCAATRTSAWLTNRSGRAPVKHDGMDAWARLTPVHQFVELIGDLGTEQAVGATVDPHDQSGSAVLDVEVTVRHDLLLVGFRSE